MTWGPDELGDVRANRDLAFPPLHADHDPGNVQTLFQVMVPFMVNRERFDQLMAGLRHFVEREGLADYIDPAQVGYVIMHRRLEKEEVEHVEPNRD